MMLSVDMGVVYRRTSAMVAKRESMVTEPSPRRQRQPGLRILEALGALDANCGVAIKLLVCGVMLTRGAIGP